MVPLGYFLIAWLAFLGLFAVLVLLTLSQVFRHGAHSTFMHISTFVFLAVVVLVVLGSGSYLLKANWNARVNVVPSGMSYFIFGNNTDNGSSSEIPLTP